LKTSCIRHPESKYILIRDWQIIACNNSHCAAVLLSLFEYIHNCKLENLSDAKKRNQIARKFNVEPKEAEDLWQDWTEDDLEERIFHLYSRKSIRAAVKILLEKKFVIQGRNPDKRIKGDQTKFFLFQPQTVQKWIERFQRKKPARGGSTGAPPAAKPAKNHPAKLPDGQAKLPTHASGKIAEPSGNFADSSIHDTWGHDPCHEGEAAGAANPPPENLPLDRDWRIREYYAALGHRGYKLEIFQAEDIVQTVKSGEAWHETLEIWRRNNYSATNLQDMFSRYHKLEAHYERQFSQSSVGSPPTPRGDSRNEDIFREIERAGRHFLSQRRAEQVSPYGLEELLDDVASIYAVPISRLKEILTPLVKEEVNQPTQISEEGAKPMPENAAGAKGA
jgi:hypothetical protein